MTVKAIYGDNPEAKCSTEAHFPEEDEGIVQTANLS